MPERITAATKKNGYIGKSEGKGLSYNLLGMIIGKQYVVMQIVKCAFNTQILFL